MSAFNCLGLNAPEIATMVIGMALSVSAYKGLLMNVISVFRLGLSACACSALIACASTNSGGGGAAGPGGGTAGGGTPGGGTSGGGQTATQAMTAFDNAMAMGPNMGPTTINPTGKANYVGKTKINTINPNQTGFNGFVIGDLNMQADFDTDALTGTATNFAGEIDNQAVTLAGTLDTANVTSNAPNTVVTSAPINVAGQSIHTTTLLGALQGKLTDSINNDEAEVQLILQGPAAFGANADRFQGGATAIIGNQGQVGFGFGGSGEFYLDRQ